MPSWSLAIWNLGFVWDLGFGIWCFSGAWMLVLGAFADGRYLPTSVLFIRRLIWLGMTVMADRFIASILIVEDDPQQIRLYAQALGQYRLTCVSTGTAALKALEERIPDLILLDNVLAKGELGASFLPR